MTFGGLLMILRSVMFAATAAVALSGVSVTAATYDAHSFVQTQKDKTDHSIMFNKRLGVKTNRLRGTDDRADKKFRFEKNGGGSLGTFETTGNTAKLTGTLINGAGQSYAVEMNFVRRSDPGAYRKQKGVSQADWSYYTMTSGSLTAMSEGLESFDLLQRGRKKVKGKMMKTAVQMGTGANISNEGMMGLFSQFRAKQQGCDMSEKSCQRFNGHVRMTLNLRPDASAASYGDTDGNPALVPLPASLLLLPAALGMMGAAGGISRRRRKS